MSKELAINSLEIYRPERSLTGAEVKLISDGFRKLGFEVTRHMGERKEKEND